MNTRAAFVLVSSLLAAGCGDDKKDGASAGGGKVASCNMPSAGMCEEYRGANLALGTESLARLCMPEIAADAKFSETACPTENLVAICAKPTGKEHYYTNSALPIADVEKWCKDKGDAKFTAVK